MSKVVSVGIVGFGAAGRVFHAPVISAVPALRLAAVVQRHGDDAGNLYPRIKTLKNADDLLGDPDIELVVVATPNATHFELARTALEAGKHVVVDKPFTVSSSEGRQLVDLAKKKGKILTVFQNRRWDGDFLTVCSVLQSKRLGRLVEFESHFDRFRNLLKPGAWKEAPLPGSGLLYDIGPHLIDQALMLFGYPPRLRADIRRERDGAVTDDQFEIVLLYPNLKVTLEAGMLAREARPRFRLYGTNGSFVKWGLDPQEDGLRRGESPSAKPWGVEGPEAWGILDVCDGPDGSREKVETVPGRYQTFYENVCEAIVNGADLLVMPEQALRTIRIIELAIQSAGDGRIVETNP